jgi:hypothetical protein
MQIEYATSDRMKCSLCKKAIGVGNIRVHKPSIYGAGAGYKSGWFHMKCYHQENVKNISLNVQVIPISLSTFLFKKEKFKTEDHEMIEEFLFKCNEKFGQRYSKKRKRDSIKIMAESELKKMKFESALNLPTEIWEQIISYSNDIHLLKNLSMVNHDFYELTLNESLWSIYLKNFTSLWGKEELEVADVYVALKLKSLGKEDSEVITSKLKFIYMFEHSCLKCHKPEDSFYSHLQGYICYRCGGDRETKLISTTDALKDFGLSSKDLCSIISQKTPTTRQGLKYTEQFSILECLKLSQKLKFKEIEDLIDDEFQDVFKRNVDDPVRIFVQFPISKSIKKILLSKIKSGENSIQGGFYCNRGHFILNFSDLVHCDDIYSIDGKSNSTLISSYCSGCTRSYSGQTFKIQLIDTYDVKLQ